MKRSEICGKSVNGYDFTCYKVFGKDSVLLCKSYDDDKTIDSFLVYVPATGELSAARARKWHGPAISLKAKISSAGNASIDEILDGSCNSFIIRTDDIGKGLLLAYLLFPDEKLDYLVSESNAEDVPGYFRNEFISYEGKGRILVDYLAAFEENCSIITATDRLDSSLITLSQCSRVRSIFVVSSVPEELETCVPVLNAEYIEGDMLPHDNDSFKKNFLEVIGQYGISADERTYAYLLNDIDDTDKLETIRKIAGHIRRPREAENRQGTSILHNVITCRDYSSCGSIASGGAAYQNSKDDCVDIVRYLVTVGFRYRGSDVFDDIDRLPYELYDSYKLGIMFRTLAEAMYYMSFESIFEFVGNFLENARFNDHLVPIDDSHGTAYWQRLDKVRCEQFDAMSPYIPDEVFSMRDADGNTLLIIAAKRCGSLPELFCRILGRTSDIDVINEDGCSALHYIGDLKRWDALVSAGADIDIRNDNGESPRLDLDEIELEKFLAKAAYSDSDIRYAERMLFVVIGDSYSAEQVYEKEDIILSLLDIVRPDAKSSDGSTFLMEMIVQEGYYPEIYDKMLRIGVDINARDKNGNSTLRIAVLSPECTLAKIRYLIEHGADESPDRYRGTVATIAAGLFHIGTPEWNALWELSDKDIFTYHTEEAMSPIMVALHYLNLPAVKFLLSHDAVPSDELDAIAERIGKIKSAVTKTEICKYYLDYSHRNRL